MFPSNRNGISVVYEFSIEEATSTSSGTVLRGSGGYPSRGVQHCSFRNNDCKENKKWIELHYRVPSDDQKIYHPHPGVKHSELYRVAYLPGGRDGQILLARFQYAFLHGHAFSVGYSQALQLDDQVTWSSWMPHKTAISGGGPFGYPDDKYLEYAHKAMDHLNVPRDIKKCQQWCLQQQDRQKSSTSTTSPCDLCLPLRQETIHFVAPRQWNETSQFSEFFEIVETSEVCNGQISTPLAVVASAPLVPDLASIRPIPPPSTAAVIPDRPPSQKLLSEASSLQSRALLRPANIITVADLCDEVKTRNGITEDTTCPICIQVLSNKNGKSMSDPPIIRIKVCGHLCHQQCMLNQLLQRRYSCPICTESVGMVFFGGGPSGSMTASLDRSRSCPGFNKSDGIICIRYEIPPGIQTQYMEYPGQLYAGTSRLAYLPNTEKGRRLLMRLRHAFCSGLIFHVGKSATTGLTNQVTWAAIPHKTSLEGGIHGYPDPQYIEKCGEVLDAMKVPG
ncbi:hypothetical protein IV203_030463 [Nitzschia inconspicua]|uniref:RING-type domain-containing protein n=1 Tax=Nitzschia inconspicua TaxID=303405 RepID=A0A9K3K4C4_9STRA|nr:hypothetical protein IV203_030463 [Nitzschia inconspicua]